MDRDFDDVVMYERVAFKLGQFVLREVGADK